MAQQDTRLSDLGRQLDSICSSRSGTFAISFINPETGESVNRNETDFFHAASTMKTPVMVEIYKQAAAKKLSLDDTVLVRNTFRSIEDGSEYSLTVSDDSDDGLYSSIGTTVTINELVIKMITVSSNLATNILIDIAGAGNIMKTMTEMGLQDIVVLRGVEDGKAYAAGKNNRTTSRGLAQLYTMMAAGSVVSEGASSAMIDILKMQRIKNMIPAQLPPSVIVAHKTGSITNVQHDSGIIYLPDGRRYILVVLSKNLRSNQEGIETIAAISKAVYQFVTQ